MEIGRHYQTFDNRLEAARLLLPLLKDLKGENPLILAVPRGAVPMAKLIAESLKGDLDVVLVRKIKHPQQPEFAIGAVTETGDILMDHTVGVSEEEFEEAALKEIKLLQTRRREYTGRSHPIDPHRRTVVIVDDGIATGSTMTAAVRSLKAAGAHRIIVAAPVASSESIGRLEAEGAEVRIYYVPEYFGAVSYFYNDFAQVSDAEVGEYFRVQSTEIEIEDEERKFKAVLGKPVAPRGVIVFANGSGSGRLSPRNQFLADFLNRQGLATILVDLLTEEEALDRNSIFDIKLLSERLIKLTHWVDRTAEFRHLPMGYLCSGTGTAAALRAAVLVGDRVSALVSRGGRLDLSSDYLTQVQIPTLFIVGGEDHLLIDLSERALQKIKSDKKMEIIPGASHLFEEPGALERVAEFTKRWFEKCFAQAQMTDMNLEPPVYP